MFWGKYWLLIFSFYILAGVVSARLVQGNLDDMAYYVHHCRQQRGLASTGEGRIDGRCQRLLYPASDGQKGSSPLSL